MTKKWHIKTKFDIKKFRHFDISWCEYKSTYVALQVNSITHYDSIIFLIKGRHIWIKG